MQGEFVKAVEDAMAKMKIVIESVSININIFHHYLESNFFFFFF